MAYAFCNVAYYVLQCHVTSVIAGIILCRRGIMTSFFKLFCLRMTTERGASGVLDKTFFGMDTEAEPTTNRQTQFMFYCNAA